MTSDNSLVEQGKKRIEWAERDMPVLAQVRARFEKEQPLKGMVLAAVLHVTAETANLVRALKAGGAEVYLAASNPLSTQDDVAAALNEVYGIATFAKKGETREEFFSHIETLIGKKPQLTMDDGADLVSTIHTKHPELLPQMLGGTEETTTGVIRLRAMSKDGALKMPVVAVNDAKTKNLFDNRYGTGQSTIDGIIRATDTLIAGKTFVVAGYGWCGKGLAMRARGQGANVVVTEIDAVKALEAAMDGYRVMPMDAAAPIGDIFCTVTGNKDVIVEKHFRVMKDGVIVSNSGHFDVEVDVAALKRIAASSRMGVRSSVDEYMITSPSTSLDPARDKPLGTAKRIYLLAEGRLVNLAAAEGHPASVMDMSFSTQALACAWLALSAVEGIAPPQGSGQATQKEKLPPAVYEVTDEIENEVASLKLAAMGLSMDVLTKEQQEYLAGWQEGT